MSTPSQPLPKVPGPRRVVTLQTSSTDIETHDAPLPLSTLPSGGIRAGHVFAQRGWDADPRALFDGGREGGRGVIMREGVVTRIYELDPHTQDRFHYLNGVATFVVLAGTMTVKYPAESKVVLKQGEVLVDCANVHAIANEGDELARFFLVVVPSAPIKIDGKELSELQDAPNITSYF